jgi:hypothetical protein
VCGATVETAYWESSLPIEDGEKCPNCGWIQNSWLLERPDELLRNTAEFEGVDENSKQTLNSRRMYQFWTTEYPGSSFRLFGYFLSIYKRWREAHPELSKRFNMCEFKIVSNEEELLTTTQPDDTFDDMSDGWGDEEDADEKDGS